MTHQPQTHGSDIEIHGRQLRLDGKPVNIGARAFDVLSLLMQQKERVVTKRELLDSAWHGLVVEENNLQVQISTLRKVLGHDAITTIPGQGYQFTAVANSEQITHPLAPPSVEALEAPASAA